METLGERIDRDGPVSELDAIGWAIRLAKRLEALHALGVAHGSVSPACILAAGRDRNARAYLADLQHTAASPTYQSPERIMGGDISAADDVWALAATLYALLTGQSPFAGASDGEVRQKIVAASPAPLAVFDVGDDDLQHILDNAFNRDIKVRTAAAAAFRRALEEWHPDRGVANLPPLEDEDATNDDDGDGARTMIQPGLDVAGPASAPRPAAGAGAPTAPKPAPVTMGGDPPNPPARPAPAAAPRPAAGVAAPAAPRPAPAPAAAPRPGTPVAAARPAPAPVAAPPANAAVPRVAAVDDDDDDDVRTVMREVPRAEMANLLGRPLAPNPGPAARAPAPASAAVRAPAPAPAAARAPAPAPVASPPAEAKAPAAQPVPKIVDEDSDDDDVRTIMRTPEQIAGESSAGTGAATMMLEGPHDPWQVKTGEGGAGDTPSSGPPSAPTVALPIGFEPVAPGLAGAHGTQKIPPDLYASLVSQPQAAANPARPPAPGLDPQALFAGLPQPGPQPPPPPIPPPSAGAPQPFQPAQSGVMGAAPVTVPGTSLAISPSQPQGAGSESGLSVKGLVIAAFVTLIVAAAATFAILKLKGL